MAITEAQRKELTAALLRAGEILLARWQLPREGAGALKVFDKPDGTKVTEADLAANEFLTAALGTIFPEVGLISEESERDIGLLDASQVIIFDPLDGTRSFIAGKDDFSILIAESSERRIEWGAMYFPAKGISAFASKGAGATVNGEQVQVSLAEELGSQTVFLSKCDVPGGEVIYREWMDSGMAFLALSRGELLGVIIKMETHKEWDIAAPSIVLSEAGGRMTDEFGNEILFNQPDIGFRYLVASNGRVHDRLLGLVQQMDR